MRTWTNKQIYIHFNWSNLTIPVCVKFVQTRLPISHSKLRFHWPSTEITHVPVWMVSFQGMDTFIYELMYISLSKVITPNGSKYEIPIYLSKPQALGFELIIYICTIGISYLDPQDVHYNMIGHHRVRFGRSCLIDIKCTRYGKKRTAEFSGFSIK